VYYPGLEDHQGHEIAKQQMNGFGGMLSFDLAKGMDTKKFLLGMELVKPTMSLAGIESTALSPRLTSHALLSEEERQAQGITEQMVRFSVGIEAIEDITKDLTQSISKIS
jgi:cystathionine beta-lyase